MATTASAANQADWRSLLGRIGLSARGVLYVAIGYLALQAAMGGGDGSGATTGGVFSFLKSQSGGTFMLGVLAVGLVALALWELTRAVFGDPVTGSETTDRAVYAIKAVAYGVIAFSAFSSMMGSGGSSGGSEAEAAGFLLGLPGGAVITGLIGLGVAAYGAKTIKENGLDAEFMSMLSPDRFADERIVRRAGQAGYAAKGVTLGMVGVFFLIAAIQHDPSEARGLGGALSTLSEQSYGTYLLGVVAVGLGLYGVYCFLEAKMRRDHAD